MPQAPSPLEELPLCLARTALDFRRFNERTLSACGLPQLAPGYASVLHALMDLQDCPVSQLVARTHLPNGTLTGLLDGLELEGHIQRVRNPADGRSWLIRLTATGKAVCKKLERRHAKVIGVLSEAVTESEVTELLRLLGIVGECMRTYRPKPRQT